MYPYIRARRDVEILFDRIQHAAPTKLDIGKGNLIVEPSFNMVVNSLLVEKTIKEAFGKIQHDGFFIALSKDLVRNGFIGHFAILDQKDATKFLACLIDVILTIKEHLGKRYNDRTRKIAFVDSLCRFLNVSLCSSENTTDVHTSATSATSCSEIFTDVAKKTIGYIFSFSDIASKTLIAINISAALGRYFYEDDHTISTGALQSMFSTLLATGFLNREERYGGFKGFLMVLSKGLCICLSHYAAANPFLIEKFFIIRDKGDAAEHYLQNAEGAIDHTSFHQATFFVSMFWTALTYIVFFGMSRPFRALLMGLHVRSMGVAHLVHQVPISGRPECALSVSTLTIPSIFKRKPALALEGLVASEHNNQLTRFKHDERNDFSGSISFREKHVTFSMKANEARDHALNYLDIMRSYLKTMAHPTLYDAYDLGNRLSKVNKNLVAPRYVMNALNAMSIAPCWIVPTGGFTVNAMDAYVRQIIETQSAHHALYNSYSVTESNNVMMVADMLRPTIKAFLYAHRTRSFVPSDVKCLGLHEYHKSYRINSRTADFLNQMDSYFFQYLKTDLGLIDDKSDRFAGDNFFNYTAIAASK
jgi:hypothetical protein